MAESNIILPPLTRTMDGTMRRIGVELEMGGLDIADLSDLVSTHVHGCVKKISPYECRVDGDPAGAWLIELDYAYLKKWGRDNRERDGKAGGPEALAEQLLRAGAEQVVPLEVVSPPLPLDRLCEVDDLVERLRAAGAKGTASSVVYAFGMQLNPELPSLDAATIRHHLQAYLCLHDWLAADLSVDLTRRLTAYIDPFPATYVRKVVEADYAPDLSTLIDDYLADNPTRNRSLDMLPLFTYLDEKRVRSVVDDDRIKARPTFHYRLPDCEIDRPGWGIHVAWNGWVEVEKLAADCEHLQDLCGRYAAFLDKTVGRLFEQSWADQTKRWLEHVNGR